MLRPYLEGTHFVVGTDHQSLRWILDLKECTGRLARWRLRLLEYDLKTVHRPGIHHQAPEAMSWLPKETDCGDEDPIDEDIPTLDIPRTDNKEASPVMFLHQDPVPMPAESEILEAQAKDPCCRNVRSMVGIEPTWVFNETGLLCRKASADGSLQVVALQRYRIAVMHNAHYPRLLTG